MTMSAMTRMPRAWHASISSAASSTVPYSGSTLKKSLMSYPPSRNGDWKNGSNQRQSTPSHSR